MAALEAMVSVNGVYDNIQSACKDYGWRASSLYLVLDTITDRLLSKNLTKSKLNWRVIIQNSVETLMEMGCSWIELSKGRYVKLSFDIDTRRGFSVFNVRLSLLTISSTSFCCSSYVLSFSGPQLIHNPRHLYGFYLGDSKVHIISSMGYDLR